MPNMRTTKILLKPRSSQVQIPKPILAPRKSRTRDPELDPTMIQDQPTPCHHIDDDPSLLVETANPSELTTLTTPSPTKNRH